MFPTEFCLSVVRKPQSSAYGEGFTVCESSWMSAVLVIFHILLLTCVWFGETGNFYLDYCCSAVNLLCSETIINFGT